jgi:hypothetical protein
MNGEPFMTKLLASVAFGLVLIGSSAAFAGEKTITLAVKHVLRGLPAHRQG